METSMRHTAKGLMVDGALPSAPTLETLPDGQHADHYVLSPEERAKGFIEPVRLAYRHIGIPAALNPLRPLTDEELQRYEPYGYVAYEAYSDAGSAVVGRYWTQAQIVAVGMGCGKVTSMPRPIAETYARDPGYYGSTFCCGCGTYLPVGAQGEFVWDGTSQRVGTIQSS